MGVNRRKFMKIAGVSVLGLGAVPAQVLAEDGLGFTISETLLHFFHKPAGTVAREALTAKRWGMAVNVRLLDDEMANACMEVCHRIHNVPKIDNPKHEVKWIWPDEFKHAFTSQEHEHIEEGLKKLPFLLMCNHCVNAPCCRVCPTQATFKRESDGIVLMDMHRCIGCRFCMAACPYGSRSFNWVDPRKYLKEEDENPEYPTRMKGVVEKCNFCAERLAKGKIPACVEICQEMAKKKGTEPPLVFGDVDDPDSELRQLLRSSYTLRRKPELGTSPNVFYVV